MFNLSGFVPFFIEEYLMKRFLLLFVLAIGLICTSSYASGDGKNEGDEILRKSAFSEPNPFLFNTSYPRNFTELNNPVNQSAISTGYYFVDSDDEAPDFWRPSPEIFDTVAGVGNIAVVKRIIQGPRLYPKEYWQENPEEGLRFFRNPYYPTGGRSFFDHGDINATDSTDDAIAGPIPLKIAGGFVFNGIRFDSFYVSTNGFIALTNRRYYYDQDGNRTVPAGATQCYDPQSNDWFARGRELPPSTGLTDPTPDDYGYTYSVCGGSPTGSATGGIRDRNTGNGSLSNIPYRAAVIAPFWGDNELSQYWVEGSRINDHGRVYYMRTFDNAKLIIYFVNIAPLRTKALPNGQSYTANSGLRPGDPQYVSASAQVMLNRLDSTITITYEDFVGVATAGGRGYPSKTVFRYNTTVGVRGYARHVNYGQAGGPTYPWSGEYEQYTHYFAKYQDPNKSYPKPYLAIRFKQWKNTLRVVDIQYRVRKSDPNADLNFSEVVKSSQANNYELLAGEERIGAIQPVTILQNLTNEIQGPSGINFQRQHLNFRARFRIINLVNNRIVYNRLVPIDSTCLALPDTLTQDCTGDPNVKVRYSTVTKSGADYSATPRAFPGTPPLNGIPPYGFVQIFFPPFEPNEFLINHIGRLKAYIVADPTNPRTSESLGDQWPFDDTSSVTLFVMKRLDNFEDDVTEFHIIENVPMPSVWKWVNIDAEVATGDEVSNHPLPPRGEYTANNNDQYPLQSPVIRMNRYLLDGSDPSASHSDYKGDQLRSFPINLKDGYGAVLSLSFQRTEKQNDWPRGWCDQQLIGPEPRTFVNGDLLSIFGVRYAGSSYAYANAASAYPDEINVELMQPSPDRVQYITNVPDSRWRYHPRRGGVKPVTNVAAYTLYGSNGYFVGFLETDRDSALDQENYQTGDRNGLRPDIFDDGIDFEYKKAFVAIPDTFIRSVNEGAKNFRFRVRVRASNDKKCLQCIPDDRDNFFLDNIRILLPSEITDIEISSVKIIWPYTIAPASQATAIPIRVKYSNNTQVAAPSFWLQVGIMRGGAKWEPSQTVFCRTKIIPFLDPNTEEESQIPFWNARICGPGQYRIYSMVYVPGGDLVPLNDTTYTDVTLRFGNVFAYDDPQNPRNDVPDAAFSGLWGRGLTLWGYAQGGTGYIYGGSYASYSYVYATGYEGGNGSGQIAMKFVLSMADTIKGFQAWFGPKNKGFDDISLSIYTDQSGNQPGQVITRIVKQRGLDDIRQNIDGYWDEYVTYLLSTPLILPAGTYWASISQLAETGIELGASKTRMGMRTTNVYIPPPVTVTNYVGGSGIHLMIEKNFRKLQNKNLINNNLFAVENGDQSGTWSQFMPTVGNPAYAHLHHFGIVDDMTTATLSRGGWIPLIRPYLGTRSFTSTALDPCYIPVEVSSFDGFVRDAGIELVWETASESNNQGFFVERTIPQPDGSENWESIGFVKGAGNSNTLRSYDFFDNDVTLNTTYKYKLRQVDLDGTQSCPSDIVTLTFDKVGKLTLFPNEPNPISNSYTIIKFNLPAPTDTRIEVLDMFGNVIKTLDNQRLDAKLHHYTWDGTNAAGAPVANGAYTCRVTAGNEVASIKMSLIR